MDAPKLTPDMITRRLEDALAYLRANVTVANSAFGLAFQVGLDAQVFTSGWRHLYHKSPRRVFTELRMQEVKRRLLRGDPTKLIAREMGFFNEKLMVNRFDQIVGVQPLSWLKRFQEKKAKEQHENSPA